MSKILKAVKVFALVIVGNMITQAIFIGSIAAYVNFLMPEYTIGTDVAALITEEYGLKLKQLVSAKIISPEEAEILQLDEPVARQVIWRVILPAYGVYPYPASIYPQIPLESDEIMQPYIDARAAAIICNLCDLETDPRYAMTKQEFDQLVNTLETGPPNLPKYDAACPYLVDRTWDAASYRSRNALIVCWNKIPLAWREDFIAEDWQIVFDLPDVIKYEFGQTSRDHASGMIDYTDRTIHLDSYNRTTPIHEFVHYAVNRVGWQNQLESEFELEAPRLSEILGDYSQTSSKEYFARYVSYWVAYPSLRLELEEYAPNTAKLTKKLIENYDTLLALYDEVP